MHFEIKHILNVIITFQLTSFSLFLITATKGKRTNNRLLAVFLFSIAMLFLDNIFDHYTELIYANLPHLFYLNFPFMFLYPPLLFMYTKSLTERKYEIKKTQIVHFLPFFIATLFIFFRYHINSPNILKQILASGPLFDPLFGYFEGNIYSSLAYIQFVIYAIASLKILNQYQTKVKEYFASVERINLAWLKFVIWGFIVWNIFNIINHISWILLIKFYSITFVVLSKMMMLFLINVIFFKGLRHPEIFLGLNVKEFGRKYNKSMLNEKELIHYKNSLLNFMDEHKPYLDPNLDLQTLAKQLSLTNHKLSQLINESFKQNFFDFINSYRINESKKILSQQESDHKTILEILYQTGFNSKSVFNTAFKKYTGMTPTEFRKTAHSK